MVINKKNWKLYDAVLNKQPLTLDYLYTLGYGPQELGELVLDGILFKSNSSTYEFISPVALSNYGMQLTWLKMDRKADACFSKCRRMFPDYVDPEYRFILFDIQKKDYKRAMESCERLCKYNEADALIFKFMIRFLIDSAKEKKKCPPRSLSLKEIDAVFSKDDTKDEKLFKQVKYQITQHKFKYASFLLKGIEANDGNSLRIVVYRKLINGCVTLMEQKHARNMSLGSRGRFRGLSDLLERDFRAGGLGKMDEHIMYALRDLEILEKTGSLPPLIAGSGNMFSAIRNHDYMSAYSFFLARQDIHGKNSYDEIIEAVLNRINSLMVERLQGAPFVDGLGVASAIDSLDMVLERILHGEKSVAEVAEEFKLDHNQVALLKLTFAKEYMKQGEMDMANALINDVEMQDFKSKTVRKALAEVKQSRDLVKPGEMTSLYYALRRVKPENLLN